MPRAYLLFLVGTRAHCQVVTLVLSRATTVRIELAVREVSIHSAEQEALGYQGKDKMWELVVHVNKAQGLWRSKTL